MGRRRAPAATRNPRWAAPPPVRSGAVRRVRAAQRHRFRRV